MTNAANVDLEPIWATLLANALEGKNIKDLLSNVGAGGGAPAVGIAPAAAGGGAAAAPAEEAKEEKEEEKEESDDDMVCTCQSHSMRSLCISDGRHRVVGLWAVRLICLFCLLSYSRSVSPFHPAYTVHQSKFFWINWSAHRGLV